jgi:ABC-2 type transport system permease protein
MTYFVAGGAGFSVIEEANAGVIERFQVTPVDRSALVFGRAARDVTALVLQSLLLVGVGSLMGLRPDVAGVALSLVLISILALALSALSNSVGLAMQNGSAFAAVFNGLSIPVLLLSGVLLPLSLAPAWLQDVSDANPLRYAVDAARSLIGGRLTSAASLDGFAVTAALAVFAVAFAVHFFHRSIA